MNSAAILPVWLPIFGAFLHFFRGFGCGVSGYISVTSGVYVPNSVQIFQNGYGFPWHIDREGWPCYNTCMEASIC